MRPEAGNGTEAAPVAGSDARGGREWRRLATGVPRLLELLAGEGVLVSVGSLDRGTGIATFPLPRNVPALTVGTTRLRMITSDFQESKNIDTVGPSIMPNTRTLSARLQVVATPAVNWLTPARDACVRTSQKLEVAASSPSGVRAVRFFADGRRVATDRTSDKGLWSATVKLGAGRHRLTATAVDQRRRTASSVLTAKAGSR